MRFGDTSPCWRRPHAVSRRGPIVPGCRTRPSRASHDVVHAEAVQCLRNFWLGELAHWNTQREMKRPQIPIPLRHLRQQGWTAVA
jgi:hypothetical protein